MRSNSSLYAFDFDGTLAPVTSEPDAVKLSQITHSLLAKISARVPVAVISGRSVDDLRNQFAFEPEFLIGNHGLEGLRNIRPEKYQRISRHWLKQLQNQWNFKDPNIYIEDKKFSLSVHHRNAKQKKIRDRLLSLMKNLEPPPRIVKGKSVLNLIPSQRVNKGQALLHLLKKLKFKHVIYVGDDETDEDVFSLSEKRLISVRVGRKITSRAQFFIKRQNEINRLLISIHDQL